MISSEIIEGIKGPLELAEFVKVLHKSYVDNPQSWENDNLATYLDAIAAWVLDSDGYFRNNNQPLPNPETWKVVAMILYAATMYE